MSFTIVDIPVAPKTPNSPIIEALLGNVGKAISIPCPSRDVNNVRKSLRASLLSKNILEKFNYRTRVDSANNALVVWLEPIVKTEAEKVAENR